MAISPQQSTLHVKEERSTDVEIRCKGTIPNEGAGWGRRILIHTQNQAGRQKDPKSPPGQTTQRRPNEDNLDRVPRNISDWAPCLLVYDLVRLVSQGWSRWLLEGKRGKRCEPNRHM